MSDSPSVPAVDVSALHFIAGTTKATLLQGNRKETYDCLDIPDPNSSLVVAAKAYYDNYLNLSSVLASLDQTIDQIYLGYCLTIGSEKISSVLSDCQINLADVYDRAHNTFKCIADNALAIGDRMTDTLFHLYNLKEKIAADKFTACSVNFKAIADACHDCSQIIQNFMRGIRTAKRDAEILIGEEEEHITELKKCQAKFEACAVGQRKASQDAERNMAEANRWVQEYSIQVVQDKAVKEAFIEKSKEIDLGVRIVAAIFSFGLSEATRSSTPPPDTRVFDAFIEHDQQMVQQYIKSRQQAAEAGREALKNVKEYQGVVSKCIEAGSKEKGAEHCIEVVKHMCDLVNDAFCDDRGFWNQVSVFTDTAKGITDAVFDKLEGHMEDTKEDRKDFYESERFKKQCVKTMVTWQAFAQLCTKYASDMGKSREKINCNIKSSPTLAQSQAKRVEEMQRTVATSMAKAQEKADKKVAAVVETSKSIMAQL